MSAKVTLGLFGYQRTLAKVAFVLIMGFCPVPSYCSQADSRPLRLTPIPDARNGIVVLPASEAPAISWQGINYTPDDGVEVLWQAAKDDKLNSETRLEALKQLSRATRALRASGKTVSLIDLYDRETDGDLQLGVLRCLAQTQDPRVLPFLYKVLHSAE